MFAVKKSLKPSKSNSTSYSQVSKIGDKKPDQDFQQHAENFMQELPGGIFSDLDDEDVEPAQDADGNKMETAEDITHESMDEYLGCKVKLPHMGELYSATIIRRKFDYNGNPIGSRAKNPILDTREYEVDFDLDGSKDFFTANMITENINSQVDQEG